MSEKDKNKYSIIEEHLKRYPTIDAVLLYQQIVKSNTDTKKSEKHENAGNNKR